ncbi:MAG: hypothetical protein LBR72_07660, partial [Oscillospiraceae bacterium]|nr:hypothetical protein [Oscillospiraceae bacterium]
MKNSLTVALLLCLLLSACGGTGRQSAPSVPAAPPSPADSPVPAASPEPAAPPTAEATPYSPSSVVLPNGMPEQPVFSIEEIGTRRYAETV